MKRGKKRCRGETRVGCRARLFTNKFEDGSWIVSLFEENHNHECVTPKKSHLLLSQRSITKSQGDMMQKMSITGIKMNIMMHYFSNETHGRQNVGFAEGDARNFLHTRRTK